MTIGELEKVYRAASGRKRLEILKLLSIKNELSVGDIASHIHLSIKSTSKHLTILRGVGFLDRRQAGYVGLYSIDKLLSVELQTILKQIKSSR